ncbi:nucleotide exchange factor GrpE [Sinimarinibacterium sp. CAU 1509]|uniref:nucleotide exchange factor GrpE n=1 Tax=Sinimarinibacterium sp. CAU 1509 TaxID=2562283 RepID=UPI0010ACF943|nr:nucleotide exchange factor GrpE [Sinimarinibacterium sp. CAU 1509]TJY55790.1 nucleotide exchange factor GrpE [Sinimarinibacterium sp. CAU 1509]
MSETPENANVPEPDLTAAAGADMTPTPAEMEALRAQLAEAEQRAEAAREEQLRALADIENTRRRLERETQNSLKYGAEKLLGELLSVCDSLELGLRAAADAAEGPAKALAEGMDLTYRQLISVLEKHGVQQLDPLNQLFNPDFHQAMSMVESTEIAPNHVHSVMQKGYTLHERLLRPAMVMVTKAPGR